MQPVGIGVIGAGNISGAYLTAAPRFSVLDVVACADIDMAAARAKAEAHGVEAMTVDALLADPRIAIVLNLTTPQHHVPVGLAAIAAGKHVYCEKPLAIAFADGVRLVEAAQAKGLRIGCAPDTFLGGSHQTARKALDAGAIGRPLAGSCFMMVPGHELWHPNPDFYYKPGGGPMFDMGPYYLTCLVNMLGPVVSVTGAAKASHAARTIASGPRMGETVTVEVATHVSALLDFANGAAVTITTSFDIWKHGHGHIEIYGSEGSMLVPDPNRFDGVVQTSAMRGDWTEAPSTHPYGDGNHRIIGLADMAQAIVTGRPHRANQAVALHVLEIMESVLASAEAGRRIALTTTCDRPAPMRDDLPFGQLD